MLTLMALQEISGMKLSPPAFSGQLLMWDKGIQEGGPKDKHIIQVFGTISADKEMVAERLFKDSKLKHGLVGDYVPGLGIRFLFPSGATEKLPKEGGHNWDSYRMDQLMTSPIWRV